MIVINMGEGLGNQMFQYAFCLKTKHLFPDQKIKIDTRYTFKDIHNGYELNRIFGIEEEECSYEEFVRLTDLVANNINGMRRFYLKRLRDIKLLINGPKDTFIRQADPTEFYSSFLERTYDDVFFQGIFANEKYFEDIKDIILKTYIFPAIEDERNLKYLKRIRESESVSIHLRRGDYVSLGLSCLNADYYIEAINIIQNLIGERCTFFVFSDDLEFARKELENINNIVFVEGNTSQNSFRDMQLMSECKHNIIANSSFSFWGAYLNKNPNKVVVSSATPYNGCKNPFTCKDWIKI